MKITKIRLIGLVLFILGLVVWSAGQSPATTNCKGDSVPCVTGSVWTWIQFEPIENMSMSNTLTESNRDHVDSNDVRTYMIDNNRQFSKTRNITNVT